MGTKCSHLSECFRLLQQPLPLLPLHLQIRDYLWDSLKDLCWSSTRRDYSLQDLTRSPSYIHFHRRHLALQGRSCQTLVICLTLSQFSAMVTAPPGVNLWRLWMCKSWNLWAVGAVVIHQTLNPLHVSLYQEPNPCWHANW